MAGKAWYSYVNHDWRDYDGGFRYSLYEVVQTETVDGEVIVGDVLGGFYTRPRENHSASRHDALSLIIAELHRRRDMLDAQIAKLMNERTEALGT